MNLYYNYTVHATHNSNALSWYQVHDMHKTSQQLTQSIFFLMTLWWWGIKECWHLTQELGFCTAVLVRQISHILQLQNTSLHTLSPIRQSANDETHHTVSNTRVFFMHSYKPVCNCWKLWYKISLNILQKLEALGLNASSSL